MNTPTLSPSEYTFRLEMKVRDYECDLQGVVNNANYLHYMEHARHEYLASLGDNFEQMHQNGYDAMVARIEIDYKAPLRSGDLFWVTLTHEKVGPKLIFTQKIILPKKDLLIAIGRVHIVVLHNGTLTRGEYFEKILQTP